MPERQDGADLLAAWLLDNANGGTADLAAVINAELAERDAVATLLRQRIAALVADLLHLPGCTEITHDEQCPVAFPDRAWRALKERLAERTEQVRTLTAEVARLRKVVALAHQIVGARDA